MAMLWWSAPIDAFIGGARADKPIERAMRLFAMLIAGLIATPAHGQAGLSEPLEASVRRQQATPLEETPVESGVTPASVCLLVQSAAVKNSLPVGFFARIIWQESRLKPNALGPLTRSGQRAQGIAQFMPGTAAERQLADPFDPMQALPKSAEFLHDLWVEFGNAGLAAAAYNAGPQRVHDWLTKKRSLPAETQAYVRIVTGRAAQEWSRPGPQRPLMVDVPQDMSCRLTAPTMIEANLEDTIPPTQSSFSQAVAAFGGTPAAKAPELAAMNPPPVANWFVQLVGDKSESKAVAAYVALRQKHQNILGAYAPDIVRTTPRPRAAPIWSRVRVITASRQLAESLCTRLRSAGESCLVQRN